MRLALKRRPQILAINNTWIPSDSSVLALRFGWTRFPDNPSLSIDYDPAQLGFSQSFLGLVNQTGVPKFPIVNFTGGYRGLGAGTHRRAAGLRGLERARQRVSASDPPPAVAGRLHPRRRGERALRGVRAAPALAGAAAPGAVCRPGGRGRRGARGGGELRGTA